MAQGPYVGRQRTYNTIGADMEAIVDRTEQKMIDVVRASIRDVVNEMQQPVAKGGRMRVDTGFLRASGRASTTGFPSGVGQRPAEGTFTYDGEAVNAVLLSLNFGDTFYWGWVANYAPYRELYDGFMEAALQNWSRIVAFNIDTVNKGSR